MYIQEITLELSPDLDADLMMDEFNWLMASYHRNGQVLSGAQSQFLSGNRIICLPYTQEKDSLSKKFNNGEVNKQLKRLETLCQDSLQFRTIGVDYKNGDGACKCAGSESYVLTAFGFSRDSAIMCGSCRLSVPLYRLPKTDGDNYSGILNWQLSSQICDGLEVINLNNPDFPEIDKNVVKTLTAIGKGICEKIETLTGIPTQLFEEEEAGPATNDHAQSGQKMVS